MTLFKLAWDCSDAINPVLAVLLLEEPLLKQRRTGEHWSIFWLRSVIGIAIAVVLAEAGKHYVVWAGHPSFPSGHTTFATAAATSIVLRRGVRWLALVGPLVLLIGWALVYAGWHRPIDIPGGLALGMAVPIGVARIAPPAHRRRGIKQSA